MTVTVLGGLDCTKENTAPKNLNKKKGSCSIQHKSTFFSRLFNSVAVED